MKPGLGRPDEPGISLWPQGQEGRARVESYACYVHLAGSETPELRFYSAEGAMALNRILAAVTREWPNFELIDVRDSHDRVVGRYSRTECLGLPAGSAKPSAAAGVPSAS